MQHPLVPPAWLIRWVMLPILAFWVSTLAGFALILFFPLLLIIAQWYALKGHPSNAHPAYWWVTFLLLVCLIYSLPRIDLGQTRNGEYLSLVLKFYVGQVVAELILFRMFGSWKFGWHTVANAVAGFIWYQYFDFATEQGVVLTSSAQTYVTIPIIALATNLITGLGLVKATQAN